MENKVKKKIVGPSVNGGLHGKKESLAHAVGHFVGHMLAGLIMFTLMAVVAVGASMVAEWAGLYVHDPYFVPTMHMVERIMLWADAVLLSRWVLVGIVRSL